MPKVSKRPFTWVFRTKFFIYISFRECTLCNPPISSFLICSLQKLYNFITGNIKNAQEDYIEDWNIGNPISVADTPHAVTIAQQKTCSLCAAGFPPIKKLPTSSLPPSHKHANGHHPEPAESSTHFYTSHVYTAF